MTPKDETLKLLRHMAGKPGHDEVKADFRQLLIEEFGAELDQIDFERPVPEVRGRIDALVGRTVFEAKSDLKRERADVERRMPDYLADREREEKEKFIGVASDGLNWAAYELNGETLEKISEKILKPDEAGNFLAWLNSVVAIQSSLPPDAINIRAELGRDSVAYRRVDAGLREIWPSLAEQPDTALKRSLWAALLRQVYGKDVDDDALWFQHTFLVIVSKCIAFAVMDLHEDDPVKLLSGEAFAKTGIHGAVESDFFDWVAATPEGCALVRRVMAHVRRFRLKDVETDVLKVLYESLIDRDERHGLGEYYTPDWLAAKVVKRVIDRPLDDRVLDPACGSGAFLFHAVRWFLDHADEADLEPKARARTVCGQIVGVDVHPVAVIIARVTYLLALAPVLKTRGDRISIPVYLGDSLQLSTKSFMGGKDLVIRVPPPPAGKGRSGDVDGVGREQLDFPETFCRDPKLFDRAMWEMREGSEKGLTPKQIEATLRRIIESRNEDVTWERDIQIQEIGPDEMEKAVKDMVKAYVVLDRLRKEGRDTIWTYVARNLSRPLWLSANSGWASVLVGNPPWIAFRYMHEGLQERFKELSKGERIHVGGQFGTHSDISALFTVRAAHLYLRPNGRLGFVLPMAALTRGQYKKFRTGSYGSVRMAWEEAWAMDEMLQPLFPVPSCVVIGKRRARSRPIPSKVTLMRGLLPLRDADEETADKILEIEENYAPSVGKFEGGSLYRESFRQGATLVPRMTCFVERQSSGRLGSNPSAPSICSRRVTQEKEPWKSLPDIKGAVEAEFLRPVLLGESILPHRKFQSFECVVPVSEDNKMIDSQGAANLGFGGLHGWMSAAEDVWSRNRTSDRMTLTGRWNYHNELGVQFPVAPLRVVYAKAGTLPAACVIRDSAAVIDHKLYWMKVSNKSEAYYLTAILNSEAARQRAEQYQSRGQWGARDFDKVVFNLPILLFDKNEGLHNDLANVGAKAEKLAAKVEMPDGVKFQRARKLVREALADAGLSEEIDALVTRLLDKA